jgi:hypothetical protein
MESVLLGLKFLNNLGNSENAQRQQLIQNMQLPQQQQQFQLPTINSVFGNY